MRLGIKRLIISITTLTILIFITIFYYSHNYTNSFVSGITYNEKTNIDYEVCLKSNNYFAEKCLGKNKTYVADIVDYINLNFKYSLDASASLKENYSYYISTEVVATSKEDSTKVLYDKKNILVPKTKDKLTSNSVTISKNIKLNYADYSNLIVNFKKDYVIALDAKLIVTMNINYNGYYDNNFMPIDSTKSLQVVIPLSEQAITITTNNNKATVNKTIYKHINNNITTKFILIILVVLDILVFIYLMYVVLKLKPAKREYLRQLDRILKEYDRAIVTITDLPAINDRNIINVANFDELLDARDNLEKPILYYRYKKKDKAIFTIINETEAYIYTLEIDRK